MIGGKNMNWIDEITGEISAIRSSAKELKKFGLTVGSVFSVMGITARWVLMWNTELSFALLSIGVVLMIGGFIAPNALHRTYRYWMSFAIVIGSVVSRILLCVIFFIFVTPIAFIAKVTGKKFSRPFKDQPSSYWILRDQQKKVNYERMS